MEHYKDWQDLAESFKIVEQKFQQLLDTIKEPPPPKQPLFHTTDGQPVYDIIGWYDVLPDFGIIHTTHIDKTWSIARFLTRYAAEKWVEENSALTLDNVRVCKDYQGWIWDGAQALYGIAPPYAIYSTREACEQANKKVWYWNYDKPAQDAKVHLTGIETFPTFEACREANQVLCKDGVWVNMDADVWFWNGHRAQMTKAGSDTMQYIYSTSAACLADNKPDWRKAKVLCFDDLPNMDAAFHVWYSLEQLIKSRL